MDTHQTSLKTFAIKSCCLTFCGFLLIGCAQKLNNAPNVRVLKTCQNPIVTYQLTNIKSGDYNDLTFANTQMQQMVENSLAQSGCFSPSQDPINNTIPYNLEIIFGNINTQKSQKNFLHFQTNNETIIEVQLNFSNHNKMVILRGKASIQNQNSQYLVVFNNNSKPNPNQIQIALQNAVNSAVNEAIHHFTQIQNTPPPNPYDF